MIDNMTDNMTAYEILTNEQMAEADRLTIEGGIDGYDLMLTAGKTAVDEISAHYAGRYNRALVLCGPGNNGGDGFIIAALLEATGWIVRLAALKPAGELKGDAAKAAAEWSSDVLDFTSVQPETEEVIIDAVFGTGFSGALEPPVSALFTAINNRTAGSPVIAVDIPSGVSGSTAEASENALKAERTITFHRKKLGHVLMPGMGHCGKITVCDIGIKKEASDKAGFITTENHPAFWQKYLNAQDCGLNKYDKGHSVIFGGPMMTGAARMAAGSAMRIGAGLCTIIGHKEAADVYRAGAPHIMFSPWENYNGFINAVTEDKRRNAVLIGPGAGLENAAGLREMIGRTLNKKYGKHCILDADALTAFKGHHETFYTILHENCVLTPHEGEFRRVFPHITTGSKLERAKEAARLSGAVVLFKGADTVIAHPDGRTSVNVNGTPDLATGGSGDVLAGMITGLMAQGTEPFYAACAAAWIHGRAAQILGKGMIATDIPDTIPQILQEIA